MNEICVFLSPFSVISDHAAEVLSLRLRNGAIDVVAAYFFVELPREVLIIDAENKRGPGLENALGIVHFFELGEVSASLTLSRTKSAFRVK